MLLKTLMSRRKFFKYASLLLASFFLVNQLKLLHIYQAKALPNKHQENQLYDWVILYWMPYDNNLSRFEMPIIEMLAKAVKDDNIFVLVQSDFPGDKQLSRRIIKKDSIDVQQVDTGDSANEQVFAQYLDWARSQFKAKKWAIVFLGHGGSLDEISPDENPQPGFSTDIKWMSYKNLQNVIYRFNQRVNNSLELLFFQNCFKGTIETHYTFQDVSKYTLSSQLLLGAPNYYYESLFEFLGKHPQIDGGLLAAKIMEFERDDMYNSYTVTNNGYIKQLPKVLNPLIDAIAASKPTKVQLNELNINLYANEQFVDIIELFKKITIPSPQTQKLYQSFVDFLQTKIIYKYKGGGSLYPASDRTTNLCGLNIWLPLNQKQLEKYGYLQIFTDVKLIKLYNAVLFS
jgi:hypothetical protein